MTRKRSIDSINATLVPKKYKLQEAAPDDLESGERLELDERTTQILEEELQGIMIKVLKALPDKVSSSAEKYVVEQLRNEASDDIRNVLGLNVTKRLLNVYNPLCVKISFTTKPDASYFKEFLKAQHISEIRVNMRAPHSYVACVLRIEDFDRLCSAGELRCGDTTATIQPLYRFSDLPMRLNTGFIKKIKSLKSKENENIAADKEKTEISSNDMHENRQQPKTNIVKKSETDIKKVTAQSNINKVIISRPKNNEVTSVNQANKISQNPVTRPHFKETRNDHKISVQCNAPKPKSTQATSIKNDIMIVSKRNQVSHEVVLSKTPTKESPKITAQTHLTKPQPKPLNKVFESLPVLYERTTQTTKAAKANEKPNITKTELKQVNKEKPTTTTQLIPTKKPQSTPKAVKPVPSVAKRQQNLVKIQSVAIKKPEPTQKLKTDVKPHITKLQRKKFDNIVDATKKAIESKTKISIKNVGMLNSDSFDLIDEINVDEFDEDEELDDEEILALISTGVVVDECSGSDEE